jgi:hypothetical protein
VRTFFATTVGFGILYDGFMQGAILDDSIDGCPLFESSDLLECMLQGIVRDKVSVLPMPENTSSANV